MFPIEPFGRALVVGRSSEQLRRKSLFLLKTGRASNEESSGMKRKRQVAIAEIRLRRGGGCRGGKRGAEEHEQQPAR